jgi:hypothetical protein
MGRPFGPDVKELLTSAARGLTKQSVIGTVRAVVCGLAAHCESAIELSLALGLGMAARGGDYTVTWNFGSGRVYGECDGDISIRICP